MASIEERLNSAYLSIQRNLQRAVSRIVPPKEVEDIVQETYVRICQVENKESIRHPRAFIMRTAHNLALDYIKRAESRLTVSMGDDVELEHADMDKDVDELYRQFSVNEEFSLLCEAIRLLPIQCRKVFVLKKVYGYTQREIAKELDLSESTVEKHIAKGIKKCTYFMIQQTEQDDPLGNHSTVSPLKGGRQ